MKAENLRSPFRTGDDALGRLEYATNVHSLQVVKRADRLVATARQAMLARRDAERITSGQAAAGLVLTSVSTEAVANRSAAESSVFEAELGVHLARAELPRALGEAPKTLPPGYAVGTPILHP